MFLGLVVFSSRLREGTTTVLEDLAAARVRCIMVTGDHIHTAVATAEQCSLIPHALSDTVGARVACGWSSVVNVFSNSAVQCPRLGAASLVSVCQDSERAHFLLPF